MLFRSRAKLGEDYKPPFAQETGKFAPGSRPPSQQEQVLRNDSYEQTKRLPGLKGVQDVARSYAKARGISLPEGKAEYRSIPIETAKKLADFNEEKTKVPGSEKLPAEVQKSYEALIKETKDQYEAIKAAGYTIEPQPDPTKVAYQTHEEMIKDVGDNKHIYFLQTLGQFDKTFEGTGKNPLLDHSGITIDGYALTNNDLFRVVHDFFGHGKEGFPFSARGEFNAWNEHAKMFSKEAQGALAAETLAQNSWVNFGPHLRDKKGFLIQRDRKSVV